MSKRNKKTGNFVPQIGERVYISRKNALGETVWYEGNVKRIRVEVECTAANITTLSSVHTLAYNVKDAVRGGDSF